MPSTRRRTAPSSSARAPSPASSTPSRTANPLAISPPRCSPATTKGKIVVVNYWASWCTPCRTETPQFDLLYRKIKTQGVDFLGIDTKDEKGDALSFVKQNDISFPIVFDEQGETAIRMGDIPQTALPFTVLLDRQGRVAAVYLIAQTAKDLQRAITKLQAEH